MEHTTQVELIQRVLGYMDSGKTHQAEGVTYNPVSMYTSRDVLAREQDILFRRHPQVVGFSAQLQGPGDYFTHDLTGVPMLVVRGRAGQVQAFLNVCRHRGARVAEGCGQGVKTWTCPYHAWSFDTEGKLVGIPDAYGFEGMDRAAHALVRLPVAEHLGLIWVNPTPGAPLDIESYAAPLAPDLASFGLERWAYLDGRVLRRRINWKMVNDTFWEAYHVKFLHKNTIAPLFMRNMITFDKLGRHHRMIGIKPGLEAFREMPREQWNLLPYGTILYGVFPNTVLIYQQDHVQLFSSYPDGDDPDRCVMQLQILIPEPVRSESAARHWQNNIELLLDTVAEDFDVGEGIQRGFHSGANEYITYGRYEPALDHFHTMLKQALGIPKTAPRHTPPSHPRAS